MLVTTGVPLEESQSERRMVVRLKPSAGQFGCGVLVLLFGVAACVGWIFVRVTWDLPWVNDLLLWPEGKGYGARGVILLASLLIAIRYARGGMQTYDVEKKTMYEAVTSFGVPLSSRAADLKGYSGVQIKYMVDEGYRVELTGMDRETLPLVIFYSEEDARTFSDRLRMFLFTPRR